MSGSGKSTIAFDILFAEGQRRYLESLNAYARQFVQPARRPDVDGVYGVPPTVAIEQRTSRGGRKSTVATLTEIYPFLRLLFVKLGVQHCPDCGVPIQPQTPDAIAARVLRDYRGKRITRARPAGHGAQGLLHRPRRVGGGQRVSSTCGWTGSFFPRRPGRGWTGSRSTPSSFPWAASRSPRRGSASLRELLARGLDFGKGVIRVVAAGRPGKAAGQETVFSTRRACPACGRSFEELDPRLFSYNSKHGWCPACFGTGLQLSGFDAEQTGEEIWWNDWWGGPRRPAPPARASACGPRRWPCASATAPSPTSRSCPSWSS